MMGWDVEMIESQIAEVEVSVVIIFTIYETADPLNLSQNFKDSLLNGGGFRNGRMTLCHSKDVSLVLNASCFPHSDSLHRNMK